MKNLVNFHFAIVTEEAEVSNDVVDSGEQIPRLELIQPIVRLEVPFLPTQLSFNVSVGISFSREASKQSLIASLISPSGQTINGINWGDLKPDFEDEEQELFAGVLIARIKNLAVEEEGEYKVLINCNNQEIGETSFFVIEQKEE